MRRNTFNEPDAPSGYVLGHLPVFNDVSETRYVCQLLLPETEATSLTKEAAERHDLARKEAIVRKGIEAAALEHKESSKQPTAEAGASEDDALAKELDAVFEDDHVPTEEELDLTRMQVPCVNMEDLKKAGSVATDNVLLAERDRVNALKKLVKELQERGGSRFIGMPADIDVAMDQIRQIAPHIPELVEALRPALVVAAKTQRPPVIAPMLLVGSPGVGKSHLAVKIAGILGVPHLSVSYAAAGLAGNALTGADKNWGNSAVGLLFEALALGNFANPVVCLDELDKTCEVHTTGGTTRNPLNELLPLLEPVTAQSHKDRCAEIRVDARYVIYVATANSLKGLSAPLLSRFRIIHVKSPGPREAVEIALSVAHDVSLEMGRPTFKVPRGQTLQILASLTPRHMRQVWTGACARALAEDRDEVLLKDLGSDHLEGVGPHIPAPLHH